MPSTQAKSSPNEPYAPKLGIHTILWGRAPESIRSILQYIAECGFAGVEFFQHPDYLREQFGTPQAFAGYLVSCELTLIGLCSGTLRERIEFCLEGGIRPEFLYVDQFDPYIEDAMAQGFTIAFHPHAYKQSNIEEVLHKVEKTPGLKLLLDPAHLFVMNENPNSWLHHAMDLPDEQLVLK